MPEKTTKYNKSLAKWLPFLIVAISSLAAIGLVAKSEHASRAKESKASTVAVDVCSAKPTFSCYKKELSQITATQGPTPAFTLVKDQYSKVPYVKSQCHQLVHVIGRAALARYGNITDTYAHGDQFCWSGYYHGAMEQLTNEKGFDYTVNNANEICKGIAQKERYSFYHYNCVHGLGHGFMFVLDGDLFASLDACNKLTDSWEAQSCYGGVFMQNIMNVQGPDADPNEPPKYLKADQPMYPCTVVADSYKQQCYLMQTSYALQVVGYDFAKVFALCDNIDQNYRSTCYTSTGRDASGQSVSDPVKSSATCALGTTLTARQYCVEGAAMDFVSYFHSDQQAKVLCSMVETALQNDCYQTVQRYYATF